ncbi:MAG: DUF2007 domain-containing protein [Actinomycetota bacterium]|nr:DUF2007 domain-containing protein [Actinomycetota bacterium]
MGASPMVHLMSVHDPFHARVIAARLGSDGILTELRGAVGGPYPVQGEVRIYVDEGDLPVARQLLLADQVEAAFDEEPDVAPHRAIVPTWIVVVAVLLVTAMWLTRGV